ncbi:MAG TPA: DUF4760 domain-containing protein [Bacillota bacterium]
MPKPTYQDAELVLRLYDLRREEVMRRARKWFMGEFSAKTLAEFKAQCPPGSDTNAYFRQVVSYWDMAAAIVLQGALHEDLFFASVGEDIGVWMQVQAFIAELRAERKNPRYLSQLEELARRHMAWRERKLAETVQASGTGERKKIRRTARTTKPAAKVGPRRRPGRQRP